MYCQSGKEKNSSWRSIVRESARFVRYWGEGHNIDSPANIRDQWEQIFGWLDEHLKPTSKTEMK